MPRLESDVDRNGPGCEQTAEQLLAAIVESSQDAIVTTTLNGHLVSWNKASERIFGYTAAEVLGKSVSILTPPDLTREFSQNLKRVRAGQRVEQMETVRLAKGGKRIAVSMTLSPLKDTAGNLNGLSAIIHDIRDRKEAAAMHRISAELFRQFAENVHEVFWMVDVGTSEVLYVSPAYEEIWGQTCESLYECPSARTDAIHPDDKTHAEATFDRQIQGEELENEYRIVHPDGSVRWIRDRAFPIVDDLGDSIRIVGVAEDITRRKEVEVALTRSERRFKRLVESNIIGVFCGDGAGLIHEANDAFLLMLGQTREDLDGGRIRWDRITVPGYEHVNQSFYQQLMATGRAVPAEIRYVRKDGSHFPALVGIAALQKTAEEAIGFVLDLTQVEQAEEALRKSVEQFQQLAENIREVFWMMDAEDQKIIYVNPAYEQVWERTRESLYQNRTSWTESVHPDDRACAVAIFNRQLAGEIIENEYRIVQASGSIRWIRDRAFPIRDSRQKLIRLVGIAEDVTGRKLAELELVRQACHDPLTDLPNRRMLLDRLNGAVAESDAVKSLFAVFFIDLDAFKLVNDMLGRAVGDQLLRDVAERLRAVARGSDTLARSGGDQFTLLAVGFDGLDSVRRLGQRLLTCLDTPFKFAGRELYMSAGIGVSMFPNDGKDPDILQSKADAAMLEAKRSGKGQIRFSSAELADATRERQEMETQLKRALAQSEFRLQFQPQFASGQAQPLRFEALLRWYPSETMAVPPARFIPIAEENGLIVPIGTWVLGEACRLAAEWQAGALKGVGVAVNVSAAQFACRDFIKIVKQTLRTTGLHPHLLELELTERVFMRHEKESIRTLTQLRKLQVTIAIDDFGTGYSSLSYLQNLPIDLIKIDQSFVAATDRKPSGAAILRCLIDLAHTLGIRVIAEGVETQKQLNLLKSLGCDEMQGFLLGRPSFDLGEYARAS
jgi:diguanylate cyclase (GGDEF)-like protein/PAS domain S-box-containing protein